MSASLPVHDCPTRAFTLSHLLGCSLLWGSSFMFIKLLGAELPPIIIASCRALVAFGGLTAMMLILGQSILPKGREWRDWASLGTLNGWLPNILVAFSLERMDSGPAALLQSSGPLMTAVLAHLLLSGERLTMRRMVGIVVGMVGVALLIGPRALDGRAAMLPILAMLGVALGYALGNIYARSIPKAEPMRLALGQQMASALFSTTIALLTVGASGYANVPAHAAPLLALGLVATAVPILFYMRLIGRSGPTIAAMTGYLVPAVALVLGILLLGEPIVLHQVLGGIIVLLGVGIVTGLLGWPQRRTA